MGIDPDPAELWPGLGAAGPGSYSWPTGEPGDGPLAERALAVLAHCCALIDAAAPACVGVKLQLACFERLGAPGWAALGACAAHAREQGLLVVADGKRGDVSMSARAYAQMLFGEGAPEGPFAPLQAELATVNPLLGIDSLAPLVEAARQRSAGLLVLVRTSNPGAADIQDLRLAGGGALWERLAELVDGLGRMEFAGGKPRVERSDPAAAAGDPAPSPLADVGAVVGATAPEHLARARELMPNAPLLLPGIGAQGGAPEHVAAAFADLPGTARRASVLLTSSRGIAGAHRAGGAKPAVAARAEAERLREVAWNLA